ncbi:MAG: prolyl-tRNA synthetase associated domain-containing protein [Ruminococcaceae bacterium]|nr:prolyl-tRNA synthetase associated domain-containing protein [Oscillospiraceae bacterium]
MEYILHSGRPETNDGRIEKEIRTYDLLDSLGIEYVRVDHEVLPTIEACQEVDKTLGIHICKNLLLCNRQKTDFYILLMPGDKKFNTKDLSAQLGTARLSFADGCYMEEFLDITPGSLSVFGLMNDKENRVRLIIDRDITKQEYFAAHPCINTSSLKIRFSDLKEKFLPAVKHEATIVEL